MSCFSACSLWASTEWRSDFSSNLLSIKKEKKKHIIITDAHLITTTYPVNIWTKKTQRGQLGMFHFHEVSKYQVLHLDSNCTNCPKPRNIHSFNASWPKQEQPSQRNLWKHPYKNVPHLPMFISGVTKQNKTKQTQWKNETLCTLLLHLENVIFRSRH